MELQLTDLHNPDMIVAFLHKNGNIIVAGDNQAFQVFPRCIEIWQELPDGRLLKVKRFLKKSVLFYFPAN